ncbi:MAG: flagellar motor protein MotB [Deltaproteobacteria bacterium]|nr:flagellar motor protein MotB [Deltaproteobacteria bacterium]
MAAPGEKTEQTVQAYESPTPPKRVKKDQALWLFSFSDMSLSLLCFFVLLLTTMEPNKQKFDNVKSGMRKESVHGKEDSLDVLSKKIKQVIQEKTLTEAADVKFDRDGLHIEFKDGLLFQSGSADPNPQNEQVVVDVMSVIAGIGPQYRMVIEGHTDDVPLRPGGRFDSNWELSASRGFSLMRQFHTLGVPQDKVSVTSFAHTNPKVDIKGLKGAALQKARAANRRVVIWIE